jgi:hypothetical protein
MVLYQKCRRGFAGLFVLFAGLASVRGIGTSETAFSSVSFRRGVHPPGGFREYLDVCSACYRKEERCGNLMLSIPLPSTTRISPSIYYGQSLKTSHNQGARTCMRASNSDSLLDEIPMDKDFLSWARRNGANISPKLVLDGQGEQRRLTTVEDIQLGEHVMTIPSMLSLSAEDGIKEIEAAFGISIQAQDRVLWKDDAWLSCWLALSLKGLIPGSILGFYTRSLADQEPDVPVLWDESIVKGVLGFEVASRVRDLKDEMSQDSKILKSDALSPYFDSIQQEDFVRAWVLVRSRAFRETSASGGLPRLSSVCCDMQCYC